MITRIALFALLFAVPFRATGQAPAPPRQFTLTSEIDAPRAELFSMWTTTEGARTVFPGADARVEGRAGGDFCIQFMPHLDPQGDQFGTNGCKVREVVPDQKIVFEWKGRPDMPALNARPFPTAVTIVFEELAPNRTKVSLTHAGFGTGSEWEPGFEYFRGAWKRVLDGLADRFAAMPAIPPEFAALPKTTLYVAQLTRGPKWIEGKDVFVQPRLMNHVLYMKNLMDSGMLLMGGRLGDADGLGILKVPDQAYAERLMAADPAVQAGTFAVKITPWNTVLPEPLRTKTADAAARK